MTAALVFASTFLAVFTLGLQSLNVNQGERLLATVTSLAIGTGHIFLYKVMPHSGVPELIAYYVGGVVGINASMSAHPALKRWLGRRHLRDEHRDVGHCGRLAPPPRGGPDVH